MSCHSGGGVTVLTHCSMSSRVIAQIRKLNIYVPFEWMEKLQDKFVFGWLRNIASFLTYSHGYMPRGLYNTNWLILGTSHVTTSSEERFSHAAYCPLQGYSHLQCLLLVRTHQLLETREGNSSGTVPRTWAYRQLKSSRNHKQEQKCVSNLRVFFPLQFLEGSTKLGKPNVFIKAKKQQMCHEHRFSRSSLNLE